MNHFQTAFFRAVWAICLCAAVSTPALAVSTPEPPADRVSAASASASEPASPAPIDEAQIREAIKTQLPAPPEGFDWHLFKNTVFLQASNWKGAEQLSSLGGAPMSIYSASAESAKTPQAVHPTLTVQIISGSQKLQKIEAKDMAVLYLKPFIDAHTKDNVLLLERSENADSERTVFRYRETPAGQKSSIVHKFVLASNDGDSVHVFTFESPEDTWKENWKAYGKPFLGKLVVLPSVAAR